MMSLVQNVANLPGNFQICFPLAKMYQMLKWFHHIILMTKMHQDSDLLLLLLCLLSTVLEETHLLKNKRLKFLALVVLKLSQWHGGQAKDWLELVGLLASKMPQLHMGLLESIVALLWEI